MEEALKLAEKSGYKNISHQAIEDDLEWLLAISSPSFWQALCRGLGGDRLIDSRIKVGMTVCILPTMLGGKISSVEKDIVKIYVKGVGMQHVPRSVVRLTGSSYTVWRAVWIQFIEHRADGKDADSFFSALISTKE